MNLSSTAKPTPVAARIVLDVWGGDHSMDHVARFLPTIECAWEIAERELQAGYLINLRQELAWGGLTPFDEREDIQPGEGALQ